MDALGFVVLLTAVSTRQVDYDISTRIRGLVRDGVVAQEQRRCLLCVVETKIRVHSAKACKMFEVVSKENLITT